MNVVVVGLGFGAEFAPIFAVHPDVHAVGVCDTDPSRALRVSDRLGGAAVYPSLEEVLADDAVDAVHLVTPLTGHAAETVAVLQAGKHCASTVPMAVTVEDVQRVVGAADASGKNYMMMETAVYTREFLHVQSLMDRGVFGEITLARGTHYQDMTGWPGYWRGLPPMWYATHALSPILALLRASASSVRCLGSGLLSADEQSAYGNPFPTETALFSLAGSPVVVEVTRTLWHVARGYTEAFHVYGDTASLEWGQIEDVEPPLLFAMGAPPAGGGLRSISQERLAIVDDPGLLPPELRPFLSSTVYGAKDHFSVAQGGGHGGSHPHLVHEFVRSIVEQRAPRVDARTAAEWTAPGIVAHASAVNDGVVLPIPSYRS